MVRPTLALHDALPIYSGIVRMLDLALSSENLHLSTALFLVAPDAREADVRAQLRRPAFSRIGDLDIRSDEHTSELQSLMRISYDVFCLKKKTTAKINKIYDANQ